MANKTDSSPRVSTEKIPLETDEEIMDSEERTWGISLKEMYKQGLAFYKDKEGKALHLSYEDRLKIVAYTQQAEHGTLDLNSAPPLGVLDVIGRDRRAAWQALGQISQVQAMAGFLHTLERLCPLFKTYVEARQKDFEAKKRQQEQEKAYTDFLDRTMEGIQKQLNNILTEEEVQKIRDAIKKNDESGVGDTDVLPPTGDANLWTSGGVTLFKESARLGVFLESLHTHQGRLTVCRGKTLTISVSTTALANNCLCWEFATDNYDIGFGLYFEWKKKKTNIVDEDYAEDDGYGDKEDRHDPQMGFEPVEILPMSRRDSHKEVFAGKHTYPGVGTYLLKFDNSYSVWRTKTLYYKINCDTLFYSGGSDY